MSLSTAYRFEVMGEKKSLQSALKRQQERIRIDEMMAERERDAKLESDINLKSNWNESLEHCAAIQKAKSDSNQMKSEILLTRQAAIKVRRAALQAQLDRDYRQYEEEFHNQGKAFYIKRT